MTVELVIFINADIAWACPCACPGAWSWGWRYEYKIWYFVKKYKLLDSNTRARRRQFVLLRIPLNLILDYVVIGLGKGIGLASYMIRITIVVGIKKQGKIIGETIVSHNKTNWN